jgi:NitT/TauT family transport system substrate-binding protein
MKKAAMILVLVILVSTLFAACGTQDKIRILLSEVTHSVFYAPQYAAINMGFFEEQGLEVELINGQGADKVMTAVLSGQVDIGFAGPEATIYVYNEGREDHAVVFAQLTKRDGSFLVGRKAIIGGRKGGVPVMTLEYVLKKHGLIPNQDLIVDTSIQFAAMAGAFTGGEGDYVTLFEPTATMLEKEGKGYVLASVGAESGEIPYTAYFATKSYIQKNGDIIQKFTNAIYKGQQWVDQHTPEEIARAIRPSFPDTDMETLEAVAKRYKDIDAWCSDPVMTEESLNLLQEVMQEAGELKRPAPHDKIVDNSFTLKAMEDMNQK